MESEKKKAKKPFFNEKRWTSKKPSPIKIDPNTKGITLTKEDLEKNSNGKSKLGLFIVP